jgi:hypothetical protein
MDWRKSQKLLYLAIMRAPCLAYKPKTFSSFLWLTKSSPQIFQKVLTLTSCERFLLSLPVTNNETGDDYVRGTLGWTITSCKELNAFFYVLFFTFQQNLCSYFSNNCVRKTVWSLSTSLPLLSNKTDRLYQNVRERRAVGGMSRRMIVTSPKALYVSVMVWEFRFCVPNYLCKSAKHFVPEHYKTTVLLAGYITPLSRCLLFSFLTTTPPLILFTKRILSPGHVEFSSALLRDQDDSSDYLLSESLEGRLRWACRLLKSTWIRTMVRGVRCYTHNLRKARNLLTGVSWLFRLLQHKKVVG